MEYNLCHVTHRRCCLVSTSQTLTEMEVMRIEISKLIERLQRSKANYAKVQKFKEKHMARMVMKRPKLIKFRLCSGLLDIYYDILDLFETIYFHFEQKCILIRLDFDGA